MCDSNIVYSTRSALAFSGLEHRGFVCVFVPNSDNIPFVWIQFILTVGLKNVAFSVAVYCAFVDDWLELWPDVILRSVIGINAQSLLIAIDYRETPFHRHMP